MKFIRRLIFRILGVNGYLTIVRKSFFIAFKSGLLKNKPAIKWHYFVSKLIKPGYTVIDIGANLGYFSDSFCRLAGENGKVYSVEPVELFRRQLKKQLAWASNSTIYNCALGAENNDEIVLGMPPQVRELGYMRTGLPSILHGNDQKPDGKNTFGAPLRKGSELFSDLEKIDYLKIDIEGYEWIVFQDMKELFAQKKPIIQAECWAENFTQIITFFTELNYVTYKLSNGKLITIDKISEDLWGADDTLFVPKEKIKLIEGLV